MQPDGGAIGMVERNCHGRDYTIAPATPPPRPPAASAILRPATRARPRPARDREPAHQGSPRVDVHNRRKNKNAVPRGTAF
jgi:hypothetical protein